MNMVKVKKCHTLRAGCSMHRLTYGLANQRLTSTLELTLYALFHAKVTRGYVTHYRRLTRRYNHQLKIDSYQWKRVLIGCGDHMTSC